MDTRDRQKCWSGPQVTLKCTVGALPHCCQSGAGSVPFPSVVRRKHHQQIEQFVLFLTGRHRTKRGRAWDTASKEVFPFKIWNRIPQSWSESGTTSWYVVPQKRRFTEGHCVKRTEVWKSCCTSVSSECTVGYGRECYVGFVLQAKGKWNGPGGARRRRPAGLDSVLRSSHPLLLARRGVGKDSLVQWHCGRLVGVGGVVTGG